MIGRKTMRNFVGQWYHVKQWQKLCTETLKKVFSNAKKMVSRNIFWQFFCAKFFMFVLLISGSCNFSFLKNSLVQINSKLNEKNRLITYTNWKITVMVVSQPIPNIHAIGIYRSKTKVTISRFIDALTHLHNSVLKRGISIIQFCNRKCRVVVGAPKGTNMASPYKAL